MKLMKIGFVSDVHLGNSNLESEAVEELQRIVESFEKQDVDTVVLLGDLIQESTTEESVNRIEKVKDIFDRFELYYTPGNHDVIDLSKSRIRNIFENRDKDNVSNQIIRETDSKSIIMVDSVDYQYKNIGRLRDIELEFIEEHLSEKRHVTLITHYPLQHTTEFSHVFRHFPERAFPTNKIRIDELYEKYNAEINIVCGHLHPDTTITVTGMPSEITMNIIEPVLQFKSYETVSINEVDTGKLVFDYEM